jgi:hypothetical protein
VKRHNLIKKFNRPYSLRELNGKIYTLFGHDHSNLAIFSLDGDVLDVREYNEVLDFLVIINDRILLVINSFEQILCVETGEYYRLSRVKYRDTSLRDFAGLDTGSNYEFCGGSIISSDNKNFSFLQDHFFFKKGQKLFCLQNNIDFVILTDFEHDVTLKRFDRGRDSCSQIRKIVDTELICGKLVALDSENYTMVSFSSHFDIDSASGSKGESVRQFDRANALARTSRGTLICDMNNDRILMHLDGLPPQVFFERDASQLNRPVHISYSKHINDQMTNCLLVTSRGSKSIHVLDLLLKKVAIIDLASHLEDKSPFAAFSDGKTILVMARDNYTATTIIRFSNEHDIWKISEVLLSSEELGDCQDACMLANRYLAIPSVTQKKLFLFELNNQNIVAEIDLCLIFENDAVMVKNINYSIEANTISLIDFKKGVVVELGEDLVLKRRFRVDSRITPVFRGISRLRDGYYLVLNRSSAIQLVDYEGGAIKGNWLFGRLRNPAKVIEVNDSYYVCNKEADEVIRIDNTGEVKNVYC